MCRGRLGCFLPASVHASNEERRDRQGWRRVATFLVFRRGSGGGATGWGDEVKEGSDGQSNGQSEPFGRGHAGEQPEDDGSGDPGNDERGRTAIVGRPEPP